MSLWSWITGSRTVAASHDAAQTNDQNRNYWANARGETTTLLTSPANRKTIRDRARYETRNNSYAAGVGLTLCNFTIGTGPRVQVLGRPDSTQIEADWNAWCEADGFAEKLRQLRFAKYDSGEGLLVRTMVSRENGVSLSLLPIECDRLTGFEGADGLVTDDSGKPVAYNFREEIGWKNVQVPAEHVIHYFRKDRPGQLRGIPEIAPALNLFAQLRQYTLAVLTCAESAARPGGVMTTDSGPDEDEEDTDADPAMYDKVEIPRGSMLVLPRKYSYSQVKAEQPTTTYGDFKREILSEIGRCLNVPANLMMGDSSSYNFASGRLDHQTFFVSVSVEQNIFEQIVARVFSWWWEEYRLLNPVDGPVPSIQCFWDAPPPVDPLKEASAQAARLANHMTTYADEYAKRGLDWETQLRQRAKELAAMAAIEQEFQIKFPSTATSNAPTQDPAETQNDNEPAANPRGKAAAGQ